MKIEIPMLTVLLLAANDLLARATLQGFETALLNTLLERSGGWIRGLRNRYQGRESNTGRPV